MDVTQVRPETAGDTPSRAGNRKGLERISVTGGQAIALALLFYEGAVHVLFYIWHTVHFLFREDSGLYYAFAKTGVKFGWSRLWDIPAQNAAYKLTGPLPFYPLPYTPPVGFLWAPLALMRYSLANNIWSVLIFAAFVGACVLAVEGSAPKKVILLLAAMVPYPVFFGLLLKQMIVLQMLGIAAAYRLFRRGSDAKAGVVLSIVVILHPQGTLVIPIALLVARRFKAFRAWLLSSAAITAVSIAVIGLHGVRGYVDRILLTQRRPELFGVIGHLSLPVRLSEYKLLEIAVQIGIVIGAAVVINKHRHAGPEPMLAVGVLASLMIVPFVHSNDFMILFVAAWLLLNVRLRIWDYAIMGAGYLIMLLITPSNLYNLDSWTMGSRLIFFEMVWLISLYFIPSERRVHSRAPSSSRRLRTTGIVLVVFSVLGLIAGVYRSYERNSEIKLPSRIGAYVRAVDGSVAVGAKAFVRDQGFPDGVAATYAGPGGAEVVVVAGRLRYGSPEELGVIDDAIEGLVDARNAGDVSDFALAGTTVRCADVGTLGGAACGWANGRAVVVAFSTHGPSERAVAEIAGRLHRLLV
ncbi:MAG: glycosyltransferase family 87 protein [Actinomycetota bacterium]|nr:DUF2029 domain-containing protein [Actinomycetota bacterium]